VNKINIYIQYYVKCDQSKLAFRLLISFRIILCSLTLSNTSSFLTWTDHVRNEEVLLRVK